MSCAQIAPAALLPPHERADLADSPWASLADPYLLKLAEEDSAALDLAEARDREMETGEVTALGHGELMRRLRA